MQDSANFHCLCDWFMCPSSNYLKEILPTAQNSPQSPVQALAQSTTTTTVPITRPGMLGQFAGSH